ncbi:MAG: DUF2281 domain-containing protein [Bacteroidota bacterium]|nr:DUF2281 domain-containing protein [Bacteroidota bacterium]
MTVLEKKIAQLPPDLQKEVEDFIESLIKQRSSTTAKKLKLQWRGALKDLKNKYTSVELQHKALEWWGD